MTLPYPTVNGLTRLIYRQLPFRTPPQPLANHPVSCRHPLFHTKYQCGILEVPLDYHDPSAGTGRIYYARYAASSNAARKGTIFVDPGELRVIFEHLHRIILIYAQIFLFDRLPVRQRGT